MKKRRVAVCGLGTGQMGLALAKVLESQKDLEVVDYDKQANHLQLSSRLRKRRRLMLGAKRALKKAGISRNSPCTCGSGEKFKRCHLPMLEGPERDIEYCLREMHLVIEGDE